MKKLFVLLVMPVLLIGCVFFANTTAETYERMDKLDEPYEIDLYGSLSRTIIYATYTLYLNENQQIYYVPESYKYNDEVFVNKTYGYYMYDKNDVTIFKDGYTKIDEEKVKDLFIILEN